ncbi:MAG: 16S rRNA (cytidine(1402)-2'-O)-methyltransferase [Thermoleophilia bacterium]|nr:16S rRNA (cytidine(1402)-2'-O)-methyltransferase [Thermoleophilia bacterium]
MLYICPTPIGNLGDITLRTLEVLRQTDLVACEDTRHTRVLLERHGVTAARLLSFHDHNEEQRLRTLLPLLREGKNVAVVSDAGMPGLSDPGFTLIRACAAEGLPVTVLPGPSAISTALVLSGLPADKFAFVGFLPRGKAKLLEELERFEGTGLALVAFESPRRLQASLAVIDSRWPGRRMAVCREITKLHEEAIRGTASEVLARLPDPVRGEIVVVLAPSNGADGAPADAATAPRRRRSPAPVAVAAMEQRAREAFEELAELGVGTKKAAGIIAGLSGLSNKRAYELGVAVKAAVAAGPTKTAEKKRSRP